MNAMKNIFNKTKTLKWILIIIIVISAIESVFKGLSHQYYGPTFFPLSTITTVVVMLIKILLYELFSLDFGVAVGVVLVFLIYTICVLCVFFSNRRKRSMLLMLFPIALVLWELIQSISILFSFPNNDLILSIVLDCVFLLLQIAYFVLLIKEQKANNKTDKTGDCSVC